MKHLLSLITLIFILCESCQTPLPEEYTEIRDTVKMRPDYSGITIPCNIAPLNFRICNPARQYLAKFTGRKYNFHIYSGNGKIRIPESKWKKFLELNKGAGYTIEIYTRDPNNHWSKFPSIQNYISDKKIDPYLVYRLIEPGYELWNEMGIYQRCLENFKESAIMVNRMSGKNCVNCHNFNMNDPNTMLLHMRTANAGTYIYSDNFLKRVNLKTNQTISAGVYPAWYPDGSKIAFSTNKTVQFFHAVPGKRVEVFDLESDIILYDKETNQITLPKELNSKENFETFPAWSPDGKYLYYCSATAGNINRYDQVKYSLLRIGYNPVSNSFGQTDTLFSAAEHDKSVSFPRISPDGKWLIMTVSDYGNFSIWHKEADLYAVNIKSGSARRLSLNSNDTESYHSWSGDGNWIVFSSRRDDGQYTRPYIAFFSKNEGNSSKPFILPQQDPDFYDSFLKAYNLPELVSGKVPLKPGNFQKIFHTKSVEPKS